jgi:endonuclease/exonuclease/phosphatase (EEP) superfamily protein YafD
MDARFPYRVLLPARPVGGIGIWSRYPIVNSGRIDGYTLWMVGARIRVPGVAVDTTVLSVHMAGPWPQPIGQWTADMARFPATLRDIAHSAGAGAVIVAGDFNATADMAPFRKLLDGGYTDAAAQAGAGLARTFPNRPPWPALLGIDHFLLRNCTPASVHTARVDGTDHLSLLATLRVPVDMTGR